MYVYVLCMLLCMRVCMYIYIYINNTLLDNLPARLFKEVLELKLLHQSASSLIIHWHWEIFLCNGN